jgi:hypothetical protein
MGLGRILMNVFKARMAAKLFRGSMRGPLGGALLAAWAGKKIYDHMQRRRRVSA